MLTLSCLDVTEPGADALILAHANAHDRGESERFWRPRRRRQALVARALLRRELSRLPGAGASGWTLEAIAGMQPSIVGAGLCQPLSAALSHSADLVACALSDAPKLGLDVERIRPERPLAAMAATAFGPREQARCARAGPAGFYRIWTLREALAKASGVGFPMIVSREDVFDQGPDEGSWTQAIAGETWLFAAKIWHGSYALALALAPARDRAEDVDAALAALA